jgi:hypothetical protein
MPRVRAVIVREQIHYRVVRPARPGRAPSLPPPQRGGGGGWFATAVGFGLCFLIVVGIEKLTDSHASPSPVVKETGRRVIASAKTNNDRCDVGGVVNSVPLTLEIDTGDPIEIDFPAKYVQRLGLKTGPYEELWPGTRYGKIANAQVKEIRVGDVVWRNATARVYSNWDYTFGSDEIPLLGLAALRAQGVHVEFEGDMCRLTVSR